jgi:hypothetical protein
MFADIVILKYNEKDNSQFIESLIPKEIYYDTRFLCSTNAIMQIDKENEIIKKENENMRRILRHQVYGLMISDHKLNEYIKTKDGIIIVLPYNIIHHKDFISVKNRIKYIVDNNTSKPILFIYDNINQNLMDDPNVYLKDFIIPHRKSFYYSHNYINKNDPIVWFKNIMEKQEISKKDNNYYDDDSLLSLFNTSQLPIKDWHHENRLRIVYLHLVKFGYLNCINQSGELCKNWIKYKTSIGHSELWNYTITRFFIEIIYKIMINDKEMKTFYYIWHNERYKFLQNGKLFLDYFSREKLFSDYAKNNWVEPDLKKLD